MVPSREPGAAEGDPVPPGGGPHLGAEVAQGEPLVKHYVRVSSTAANDVANR